MATVAARWQWPAWRWRRQLGQSAISAIAAARSEMRQQHGGGGSNNGVLAVAAWRMLIIILIITMTMIIEGGGGKEGERAGCKHRQQSLRWTAMTIAMVIV